jgi:hypothetical protein
MTDTNRQWPGSPYTDDEVRARIAASREIGMADFNARGGFSKDNAFYLSFADGNRPKGSQWLGGCYIRADSIDEAMVLSRALGINPGGEVRIYGPFPAVVLVPEYENKLLDEAGIEAGADLSKMPQEGADPCSS